MKPEVRDCGCKHNDTHWLYICDQHRRTWEELHEQAQEDHRNARPSTLAE